MEKFYIRNQLVLIHTRQTPTHLRRIRIENFYPSITEKLLTDAITFAKQHTSITDRDIDIIMHSRKSLLFDQNTAWIKKNNSSFDVTMGSYDGTEVCELVGLFILNDLCNEYGKDNIGLYRDDGLAIFKHTSRPQAERIKTSQDASRLMDLT